MCEMSVNICLFKCRFSSSRSSSIYDQLSINNHIYITLLFLFFSFDLQQSYSNLLFLFFCCDLQGSLCKTHSVIEEGCSTSKYYSR